MLFFLLDCVCHLPWVSLHLSVVLDDLTLLKLSWRERLSIWASFNQPATVARGDRQEWRKAISEITVLSVFLWEGSVICRHTASFSMHKIHHAELLMRWQFGGLGSTGYASSLQESMKTESKVLQNFSVKNYRNCCAQMMGSAVVAEARFLM